MWFAEWQAAQSPTEMPSVEAFQTGRLEGPRFSPSDFGFLKGFTNGDGYHNL